MTAKKHTAYLKALRRGLTLGCAFVLGQFIGGYVITKNGFDIAFASGSFIAGFVFGALSVLMKSEEENQTTAPNQSLETTTLAVTPAASHPSRQPGSRLT